MLGEYLVNAQGEDVVAGIRTPKQITDLSKEMPKAYKQFMAVTGMLEKKYQNMQDVEFTIEQGTLYMLQTRNGKRTAKSAIKIAVDMAKEKLITKEEAVGARHTGRCRLLCCTRSLTRRNTRSAKKDGRHLASGVNASPGAAVGVLAFDADLAEKWQGRRQSRHPAAPGDQTR